MESGLVERLRTEIQDERYNTPAFTLSITDENITEAMLEIKPGWFGISTVGGSTPPIYWDLNADKYNTVAKLARQLTALTGVSAQLEPEVNETHPSVDIEPCLPTEIGKQSAQIAIRTRRFSDKELRTILRTAIRLHNPAYDLSCLPPEEEDMVIMLAQSRALAVLANDSAKRKGLEESVDTLLSLSKYWGEQYDTTYARNKRVIPSPQKTPKQQATNNTGDITVATMYRRSPRNGFMTPMGSAGAPAIAILQEAEVEDIQVILKWDRDTSNSFLAYELWRDTVENVQRNPSGGFNNIPQGWTQVQGGPYQTPATSRLVYSMNGPNSTWGQFTTRYGQLTNAVVDQNVVNGNVYGLEPDTDYFYRLYALNVNRDIASSDVLHVHTKPRRALFAMSPLSVARGPVGTVLQVAATNVDGNTSFTVDGKALVNQSVVGNQDGTYTISGAIPPFYAKGPKDLVLRSGDGLKDVLLGGFTVTA